MAAQNRPLVTIADDDPDVVELLRHGLSSWGYRVRSALSKSELFGELAAEKPGLLLLDLRFGEADGLEVLQQLLERDPSLAVAVLTAHGSIDSAVTAMRLGAYDYLTKPPDPNRLRVVVSHACEKQALATRVRKLEELLQPGSAGLRLVGESPAFQRVLKLIRSVAPTDATVLILGESGTGKELTARAIHNLSPRQDGPFVPQNMAALPRDLAESLLFGHEKGAFTGADRAQAGTCELADKGTLFLDELGELDLTLQSKLLRFLQERTVQRVGNPKAVPVDVRVVAATNRDLAAEVRAGRFREDLYYRLNVIPIVVPPLRERPEDIPLLAARFLARAALKYHRDSLTLSSAACEALTAYPWPGNIRQLENLMERLAILHPDPVIEPATFASEFAESPASTIQPPQNAPPVGHSVAPAPWSIDEAVDQDSSLRAMDRMERQAIIEALGRYRGSVREVSHALGLSQATVYRKLKRYGISLDDYTKPPGG